MSIKNVFKLLEHHLTGNRRLDPNSLGRAFDFCEGETALSFEDSPITTQSEIRFSLRLHKTMFIDKYSFDNEENYSEHLCRYIKQGMAEDLYGNIKREVLALDYLLRGLSFSHPEEYEKLKGQMIKIIEECQIEDVLS